MSAQLVRCSCPIDVLRHVFKRRRIEMIVHIPQHDKELGFTRVPKQYVYAKQDQAHKN